MQDCTLCGLDTPNPDRICDTCLGLNTSPASTTKRTRPTPKAKQNPTSTNDTQEADADQLPLIARLYQRFFKNKRKPSSEPTEAAITILHPKDANLTPTKSEYILQYKPRGARTWSDVPTDTPTLPKGQLRMWRLDTWRVSEGHCTKDGRIIMNGTYTGYEYLGEVTRDQFNMHHGKFNPEYAHAKGNPEWRDQRFTP